jgi:uncharacterized protein YhaN
LIHDLERHRATLSHLEQLHRGWKGEPPDSAALRADFQRQQAAAPAVAQLEARRMEAHTRAVRTQQQVQTAAVRIEAAQVQRSSLQRQLDALTSDGKDDAVRAAELREIALRWSAARAELETAQGKLAAFSQNPEQLVATLETQIEALRRRAQELMADEARSAGRLQKLEEEAPYAALARTEEAIARLESDIARERAKADALRLLHETVTACRADVLACVTAPVETRALQVLQCIGGHHLSALRFDEKLGLAGITPSAHSEVVDTENLSGGEQEQVHLAVRLALAQVLARDERQMVVLDDILIATDSARFARILGVFEALAQQLQIIILTCHPERYYGLNSGTRFFDLEKIKLG